MKSFGLELLLGCALAVLLFGSVPAAAHPLEPGDCAGHDEAVLGAVADRAAMELVAWVLETDCLLDSGDHTNASLPQATLDAYDGHSVVVVGGTTAVPQSKLKDIQVTDRLGGTDRLETMRAVVSWADAKERRDAGSTGSSGSAHLGMPL